MSEQVQLLTIHRDVNTGHISLSSFLLRTVVRVSGSGRAAQLVATARMVYQECSGGREVKVNIINARDEKRKEAEGVKTKTDTACMILFSFFYGCKLSTEEGRRR